MIYMQATQIGRDRTHNTAKTCVDCGGSTVLSAKRKPIVIDTTSEPRINQTPHPPLSRCSTGTREPLHVSYTNSTIITASRFSLHVINNSSFVAHSLHVNTPRTTQYIYKLSLGINENTTNKIYLVPLISICYQYCTHLVRNKKRSKLTVEGPCLNRKV